MISTGSLHVPFDLSRSGSTIGRSAQHFIHRHDQRRNHVADKAGSRAERLSNAALSKYARCGRSRAAHGVAQRIEPSAYRRDEHFGLVFPPYLRMRTLPGSSGSGSRQMTEEGVGSQPSSLTIDDRDTSSLHLSSTTATAKPHKFVA